MSRRLTFTTFIEREDDEIEVRVTYTCTPFVAATYWQPAEGGEVDIETAEFVGVDRAFMPAPITDAEFNKLTDEAASRAREDMAAEAADHADYLYEQRRDWMLTEPWERNA